MPLSIPWRITKSSTLVKLLQPASSTPKQLSRIRSPPFLVPVTSLSTISLATWTFLRRRSSSTGKHICSPFYFQTPLTHGMWVGNNGCFFPSSLASWWVIPCRFIMKNSDIFFLCSGMLNLRRTLSPIPWPFGPTVSCPTHRYIIYRESIHINYA